MIGISSSLKSKASDAITTSNVVSRLFVNEYKSKLSPLHVKVITERQEVYLMGLLNSKEVEDAIKIAKSSKGVKKVIPLFEIDDKYINSYWYSFFNVLEYALLPPLNKIKKKFYE